VTLKPNLSLLQQNVCTLALAWKRLPESARDEVYLFLSLTEVSFSLYFFFLDD